nr:hypothetical protein [Tanacetum cinerariifolium]
MDLDDVEEEALTTLKGVNTRVTELVAVQEKDTQDIYGVMEDAQGRQTEMFQRVEMLVDDSQYHYETGRLVDQEARYLRDVAKEEALTTLEGVNTRGRQTEIFQRVEALVDDSQYHYETGRLVDQEARCSREAWAHSIGLSSAVHFELQGYMTHTWVQDQRIDAHDTLLATLTTQLSSLQGHIATALGKIRALQAREQARAGAPEGASSST